MRTDVRDPPAHGGLKLADTPSGSGMWISVMKYSRQMYAALMRVTGATLCLHAVALVVGCGGTREVVIREVVVTATASAQAPTTQPTETGVTIEVSPSATHVSSEVASSATEVPTRAPTLAPTVAIQPEATAPPPTASPTVDAPRLNAKQVREIAAALITPSGKSLGECITGRFTPWQVTGTVIYQGEGLWVWNIPAGLTSVSAYVDDSTLAARLGTVPAECK
jgi:hypothetical protein